MMTPDEKIMRDGDPRDRMVKWATDEIEDLRRQLEEMRSYATRAIRSRDVTIEKLRAKSGLQTKK